MQIELYAEKYALARVSIAKLVYDNARSAHAQAWAGAHGRIVAQALTKRADRPNQRVDKN